YNLTQEVLLSMQRVFGQTHCIRAPLFILLKVSHMSYYITRMDFAIKMFLFPLFSTSKETRENKKNENGTECSDATGKRDSFATTYPLQ
ncbi:hypothetical protein, partial [uncultured Murdochiella sp.]|uniref:hypothetical protein n=1 Tax=uncultured Murdochiella sp. TaxID=1586095 RepID=UPI002803CFCA